MNDKLTPTEELIIELLVARWRLGEDCWTISTRHTKALSMLQDKSYLNFQYAPTEHNYTVFITKKALRLFASPTYTLGRRLP